MGRRDWCRGRMRMSCVRSTRPLVQYDGTPRLVQGADADVMRAVNTPFFVALDTASRTYYLKGAGHWFSAPDPMGPFQYTKQIPAAISQLADSSGYSDPQQAIPDDE